jgi:putative intracellular protease/amidase
VLLEAKAPEKVLMMLHEGVKDVEFLYPYYRFREEGYKADVVATGANETYIGKHGVPMKSDLSLVTSLKHFSTRILHRHIYY